MQVMAIKTDPAIIATITSSSEGLRIKAIYIADANWHGFTIRFNSKETQHALPLPGGQILQHSVAMSTPQRQKPRCEVTEGMESDRCRKTVKDGWWVRNVEQASTEDLEEAGHLFLHVDRSRRCAVAEKLSPQVVQRDARLFDLPLRPERTLTHKEFSRTQSTPRL